MPKQSHAPRRAQLNPVPFNERLSWGVGEWARARGISRSQAALEVRHGRLKVLRMGRRTLVTREADAEWVKQLAAQQSSTL